MALKTQPGRWTVAGFWQWHLHGTAMSTLVLALPSYVQGSHTWQGCQQHSGHGQDSQHFHCHVCGPELRVLLPSTERIWLLLDKMWGASWQGQQQSPPGRSGKLVQQFSFTSLK